MCSLPASTVVKEAAADLAAEAAADAAADGEAAALAAGAAVEAAEPQAASDSVMARASSDVTIFFIAIFLFAFRICSRPLRRETVGPGRKTFPLWNKATIALPSRTVNTFS
jgi:hypothetical protein